VEVKGTAVTELVNVVPIVLLSIVPVLLVYRTYLVYKKQKALIRDLDAARIQGRQWRDETRALLKGLGEAIDRQFVTWKLTEAEREIGLLILKGLSLKEIAAVRVTSERTIRAQARSIYAKHGLSGRGLPMSEYFSSTWLALTKRRADEFF
jgi:DNA-binding CsgD family transcriptional regulator